VRRHAVLSAHGSRGPLPLALQLHDDDDQRRSTVAAFGSSSLSVFPPPAAAGQFVLQL
jgi:hypothetical protein